MKVKESVGKDHVKRWLTVLPGRGDLAAIFVWVNMWAVFQKDGSCVSVQSLSTKQDVCVVLVPVRAHLHLLLPRLVVVTRVRRVPQLDLLLLQLVLQLRLHVQLRHRL